MAYDILVVDDEPGLREMVQGILAGAGYTVRLAGTCAQALQQCRVKLPDGVLLDVMLPDGDGFALLGQLRDLADLPVLFLSARDEDADRLRGLGLGADDYITKPFAMRELMAPPEADRLGETELCWGAGVLRRAGREIPLTAKEFTLLKTLWANRGNIVTIDALCAALWTGPLVGYENTLMVHIRRLREKLEADPSHPKYLKTVRGLGYRLVREERP